MKKLNGFKQILNETTDLMVEMDGRFTRAEATALAFPTAIRQLWSLMGSEIGGEKRIANEVFGISYREFVAECDRRKDLVENSRAMGAAKERFGN
ncbi:MAG TPA: hypothetical protein VG895_04440 [Patescibacteria group bacterium]|nr:hypothetical protein [Patescibacteria group bacterium]